MYLARLLPLVSAVAAFLWLAAPPAVQAGRGDDFGHAGFYLGVGGLLTAPPYANQRIQGDWGHSLGVDGRAGYRILPHLSAEVEARWQDDLAFEPLRAGQTTGGRLEPVVFTANARVHFMLSRIQPFLLAGCGGMTTRVETVDTAPGGTSSTERDWGGALRFGGGFDVYVTKHIIVNTEVSYVYPMGDVSDFDLLSFGWGLEYRF